MKTTLRIFPVLFCLACGPSSTKPSIFQIEADVVRFPQDTPQHAMTSACECLRALEFEYCAAHLMSRSMIADEAAVREFADGSRRYYAQRGQVDDITKFEACVDHGAWRVAETTAHCDVPELEDRWDFDLVLEDGYWVLH